MDRETKDAAHPPATKALNEDAAPSSRELLDAFDEFLGAFEAFKSANDERLNQIEHHLSADVVTSEKVDRINRALSEHKRQVEELSLKQRRPALNAAVPAARDAELRAHKAAFERYVRHGDADGLVALERKALASHSDPDGGYVVPAETEAVIDRVLRRLSPVREIATVRQIGAASYRKPVSLGAGAGWVGESAARPETASPSLSVVEFPAMELYAMPAATQALLDDAHVDIEQWLASEVEAEFAEQEGQAFVAGDGINKPRGFLSYETVTDSAWSWGKIGYVPSGAAGAFAASNPSDRLIDLVYTPKQTYRANGRWVMNRKVESEIRKFRDAQGHYLWQPGAQAGQAPTLLGYPITEAEDMPDIAANAHAIAFGDFARGYLVVDRVGVRVLRDPFSAKPYVLFYTTKRVGGGVQNFEAIKLMRFAAS